MYIIFLNLIIIENDGYSSECVLVQIIVLRSFELLRCLVQASCIGPFKKMFSRRIGC